MRQTGRISVLFLALCLVAAPALAQELTLGVKGGALSSNVLVDDDEFDAGEFLDRRTGFSGGGFLTVQFPGPLGLQIEGLYTEKGFAGEAEGIEGNVKLAYLEFPVLLRAALPAGTVRPFLFGGPAIAFEQRCEFAATFEGERFEDDCDTEDFAGEGTGRRSTDIGAVIGGGIELATGPAVLVFDLRYTRGLQNLDESGDSDIKNEAFSLMAGIGFRLGN